RTFRIQFIAFTSGWKAPGLFTGSPQNPRKNVGAPAAAARAFPPQAGHSSRRNRTSCSADYAPAIASEMLWYTEDTFVPSVVRIRIDATETSARISAYSTIAWPSSSRTAWTRPTSRPAHRLIRSILYLSSIVDSARKRPFAPHPSLGFIAVSGLVRW